MTGEVMTAEETTEKETRYIFEILFDMLMEFFGMFKYLFNDVWLGKDA